MINKIKKLLKRKPNLRMVVWLVGSFSSGKTTQSKMFCEKFSDERVFINKDVGSKKIKATLFGKVSNIGLLNDNACSGADNIQDKISRALSVIYCTKNTNITFVDGALFTNSWWDMFLKNSDIILLVLLEHNSFEKNLEYLKNRRGIKEKDYVFRDRTLKNLKGHNSRAHNIYYKHSEKYLRENDRRIAINASLSKEEIHRKIVKKIYKMIKRF